jgi:tetratricopeptide (TPR) repeat protein
MNTDQHDAAGDAEFKQSPLASGAVFLAASGRYHDALAAFDHDTKTEGEKNRLLIVQALTLDRIGLFSEALACCEEVIAHEPRNPDAWFVRGLTLYYLVRTPAAIQCLDRAV